MSDRAKNLIFGAIGALALMVIVVGLTQGGTTAPTDAERVDALASSIKCPFCNGESLSESQSSVAGEYRVIIAQRVADGATDDEVIDEFASKFGDSYILDTSTSRWSLVLWLVPILALVAGATVVAWMYHSGKQRAEADR
jgi:cytochrome c-type biogenesis protein CcmH